MKFRYLAVALLASTVSLPAFAKEHIDPATGENVTHYEGATVTNKDEALKVLTDKTASISLFIAKEKLEDGDLESIHEATYSLENAVDFLRNVETDTNRAKLDSLDEAVQALHSHSENHEEAASREWFAKLALANEEVKHAF